MEHYGILGTGTAPKKVITASLDDIGTKVTYHIPWYGNTSIPESLEVVYDWMLDNEATFRIIAAEGRKPVPKVLAKSAIEVDEAEDVDITIIRDLKSNHGLSAILWDQDDAQYTTNIATTSINLGLPTLELTNGLTPIILESDTPPIVEVTAEKADDDMEELDVSSFDRETLEVMPAAHVKRLARNAGYEVKTKEEAIKALLGGDDETPAPTTGPTNIAGIEVTFTNGDQITYLVGKELLAKIHELILAEHTKS